MLYTERKNLRVCRLFDASPEVPFIVGSANHQLPMHFFFIQTILL